MRFIIGCILVVLGVIALAVPTFTYFTTEHLANTRYFRLDVDQPHTIIINPIVGVIALTAGIVLIVMGRGQSVR